MSKLLVRNYYPTTVPIDGAEIRIRVSRMSASDFMAWAKRFDAVNDPPSERTLTVRDPAREDEQATRLVPRAWTDAETAAAEAIATIEADTPSPRTLEALPALQALIPSEPGDEVFVMPDAAVRTRRLAEMTPEQRTAWDAIDAADERRAAEFVVDTITRYIEVEPGEIDKEGADLVAPLTSGADLVRYFGGHAAALRELVAIVRVEHTLSTALKNDLRSARASRRSSAAADLEGAGIPGPTAAPVAPEASVGTVAAMASTGGASSGSMTTSN